MDMRPPAKIPMARKARMRAGEPPEEKKPPLLAGGVEDELGAAVDVDAVDEADMVSDVDMVRQRSEYADQSSGASQLGA